MKLLLDTHALLWWLDGDERLPEPCRELIWNEDNIVLVSAASAWEITTKARLGKLPGAVAVAADFRKCLAAQGFTPLAISLDHAVRAGNLPGSHRDPFDRMLIAQSQAEGVPLISNETLFDQYGIRRIW
ncbi:type II toxin-antitoxin system VapC family toxin [Methylomagnum ishizawai]|uniref:type II toxin-antitoxin system VapC family toxin n=1 Tax=Methylomagnum ishizawai TaxID=1760988 RepID=UPI001C32E19E|nr:type II toxin-antitoxin system VapC family toxin [Methylomagnum ishizawai]BBL74013.1 twitching motility protein PilT [Methylomagnum ishizawai]